MSQHMQDPNYKEEKQRLFAKIRGTTLAQDDQISRIVIELAENCPLVFGTTEEKLCKAVKKEIDPSLFKDEPLDESLLVPEDLFFVQHQRGPACIHVWVEQKNELLEISVESLSESVSRFKDKIAAEIEVPANKQKLKLEFLGTPGPFKDNLSLAYYNVVPGDQFLSLSW